MWANFYAAECTMEERLTNARRIAEQGRLLREIEGPRKAQGWWKSAALAIASLLGVTVKWLN